jgi:ATP-dependent exoDNAse (exonuclease V) alpha subunit
LETKFLDFRSAAIETDVGRDSVRIRTHEREPREVSLDTSRFFELSLSYAVHVYKAQGVTTEQAGVLIGGWQTDREGAYVALTRAREQTKIYVTREDLGGGRNGSRRDRATRRSYPR